MKLKKLIQEKVFELLVSNWIEFQLNPLHIRIGLGAKFKPKLTIFICLDQICP